MENKKITVGGFDYVVSDEEIKEGDFAVNIEGVKQEPNKVIKNKYGYLGFVQQGWFSWLPIGKRHKKIIFNSK